MVGGSHDVRTVEGIQAALSVPVETIIGAQAHVPAHEVLTVHEEAPGIRPHSLGCCHRRWASFWGLPMAWMTSIRWL